MAEEPAKADTPEPAKTPEPTTEPAKDDVVSQADNPDAVKRALDAERKAAKDASKRAEAAEAKVREYEEANASELEKLTSKAQKAEEAKATAEAKLTRYEIAAEKNVPAKLVPLLTGTTREELEAQADLIIENAKEPAPDFNGGPRDPSPDPKTPEEAHKDFLMQVFGTPSQ